MRTAILFGFLLLAAATERNPGQVHETVLKVTGLILFACMAMDIIEFILGVGW